MDIRDKERMDVIMEHIVIARDNSDKIQLKVTDGYYVNFGRSYYHIDFDFINLDGSECRTIYTMNNSRITWYIYPESYYMIDSQEVLDNINNNIRKDHGWVRDIVEYHTYGKGHVSMDWSPTRLKKEETRIKPEPKEKTFDFIKKDDILEEYIDVNKLIGVEERALGHLNYKKLGLAKEYYNRKNDFNIGDIVYGEDWNGGLEFAVIDSIEVYKMSERREKEVNDIEKEYWISIHTTPILKSGKAKKNSWGTFDVKGKICKEKEFTKFAMGNNVKGILNKDNVTKLYNKLNVNQYEQH